VFEVLQPRKLNYWAIGNRSAHLHCCPPDCAAVVATNSSDLQKRNAAIGEPLA